MSDLPPPPPPPRRGEPGGVPGPPRRGEPGGVPGPGDEGGAPKPPQYNVYPSRRRLRDRFGPLASNPLESLRKRREKGAPPAPGEKPRKKITPLRVLKWVALAAVA